jgi:hypothetical protein
VSLAPHAPAPAPARGPWPVAPAGCRPALSVQGAQKGKKMKSTFIRQMAIKWGRQLPFFIYLIFVIFYGVFVRFSTRGVQKHRKSFLGKIHVKNFWPKKLRKQTFFLSSLPFDFFYHVFCRFYA